MTPRTRAGLFPPERLDRRLAPAGLPAYDLGDPTCIDLWVDPLAGDDARQGDTRSAALRTVAEAWRRIPVSTPLATGVRVNLVAGTYPQDGVPPYWENRRGTAAAPVILRAADGAGTARLPTLNIFGCSHLVLDGLVVSARGGDVVHLDSCQTVLLRDVTIRGDGDLASYDAPQETLKVNQSRGIYVERCDISGAWDNAVDFVAVQDGHVVGSRIHRAGDWAMYVKGGSANIVVTGNEFFAAGTGGFTAGQGTGFEFMTSPWLHHEATGIAFTNNVVHDTEGAAVGVNGGRNVLVAHNTFVNVGTRSHVVEVGFGLRTCDGDRAACAARLAAGGWGTATAGAEEPIPNQDVFILNNVFFNPDGVASRWQHVSVADPRMPAPGSNIPAPARADDGLVIRGNLIWNGPADHPLGVEGPLAAAITAHNAINTLRPVFVDPAHGDFRFAPDFTPPAAAVVTEFAWTGPSLRPAPPVPTISAVAAVAYDSRGAARTGPHVIGAFASAPGGVTPPGEEPPPADAAPPRIVAVVLPPAATYRRGATLTFVVRFDEPVVVSGQPRLGLGLGPTQRAIYVSGSGSHELVFRYVVAATVGGPRRLALAPRLVFAATAGISDLAGNAASGSFAPPPARGILVWSARPR